MEVGTSLMQRSVAQATASFSFPGVASPKIPTISEPDALPVERFSYTVLAISNPGHSAGHAPFPTKQGISIDIFEDYTNLAIQSQHQI